MLKLLERQLRLHELAAHREIAARDVALAAAADPRGSAARGTQCCECSVKSSPRTFRSPLSPQRAAAWCSVTRTINVSGQRRPTFARSTQSSACTRSRSAPRSTVRKPDFEPVGDGGFDLNRRHALERALDDEVARSADRARAATPLNTP